MDGDKITRITEALYRVTDLMPDQEPLKWSLRERAVFLMNFFLGNGTDRIFKDGLAKRERAFSALNELLGMLDVASSNTFISRINFEVLSREYTAISECLKVLKEPEPHLLREEEKHSYTPEERQQEPKPPSEPRTENSTFDGVANGDASTFPESGSRKKKILQHLESNGWVSMGKLVEIFEDRFSEKTIQRDLADLAEEGLIKREGDKRWRRYTILSDI